jgi:hypothetical protein
MSRGKWENKEPEAVITEVQLGPKALDVSKRFDVTFNPPGPFPKQWSGTDGNDSYTITRGGTVTLSGATALELLRALPEAITIKEHCGAA